MEKVTRHMASTPILGKLETARALSMLVDIISSTSTSMVLGIENKYSDPICEALWRLYEGKTPLYVQRELIPGNPESIEKFDIRTMLVNKRMLMALLNYRLDTAVPESGMDYEHIVDMLGKWEVPSQIDATYSFDG